MLLCSAYRPQLKLYTIISEYNCQNMLIVGDLNQHLVERAFI